ncbi:nitric oxide reductase activation protein NorD, partial [Pseudomonas sp. ATCC 13867]
MTIHLEIEEGFGRAWHRFITRRASPEFEDAAVALDDVRRSLLLLFRGTGGEAGVGVEAASARELLVRRSLLQQVAGTCQQLPVAWFDADSLRLPAQLAVFPRCRAEPRIYR